MARRTTLAIGTISLLLALTISSSLAVSRGRAAPDGSLTMTMIQPGRLLSVHGAGTATVQASSMTMQILAGANTYPSGRGIPSPADADPYQSLVDALVAAGIPADQLVLSMVPGSFFGHGGMARLTVSLSDPSIERVHAVVDAVTDAATSNWIEIVHIGGRFAVDDCATLETEALRAATEDARARAEMVAGTLGIRVGEMLDVSESSLDALHGPYGLSPCDPPDGAKAATAMSWLPVGDFAPIDLSSSADVTIVRVLHITYAIE